MIAYFKKNSSNEFELVGIWQDQHKEKEWLKRTAASLGHNIEDVKALHYARSMRNDKSYTFDSEFKLQISDKVATTEEQEVLNEETQEMETTTVTTYEVKVVDIVEGTALES